MGMPCCNPVERGVESAVVPAGLALAKFIGNCHSVNLFRYWHNPFFCGRVKKGMWRGNAAPNEKGREKDYRRLFVIEAGLDVLAQPADCIRPAALAVPHLADVF